MKRITTLLLSFLIAFVSFGTFAENTVRAETEAATALTAISKALLGRMAFDTDWVDVNADGAVDVRDLVCLKKHCAGVACKNFKAIKSITVTYYYTDKTVTEIQYTSACVLPALTSGYWKRGTTYYTAGTVLSLTTDTAFTYSATQHIDTPIIPF